MTSKDALREFAENIFSYCHEGIEETKRDFVHEMREDLTALISEHYVERELYEAEKELNTLLHEAMITAEKRGHDKAMEAISEHYYPKEFTVWLGFMSSSINYREIDDRWLWIYYNEDTMDDAVKEFTLDELFNYWKENER